MVGAEGFEPSTFWSRTPPHSWKVGDVGDAVFERSRDAAEKVLAGFVDEARHKGRTEHLVERLIESKTGAAPEYVSIADLAGRWLGMTRDAKLSAGYTAMCNAIFGRFLSFMQTRNPKARFLYQVKPTDANAFAAVVRDAMSPKTYREHIRLLRPAFDRFLPSGAMNPFRAFKSKRESNGGAGESIHRRPFSPEELQAIIATANGDDLMHGLIIAGACSGLRRGDVCGLKWGDVDLTAGMIAVKTSKTGAQVEIPIFPLLRAVLEERKGNGSKYVFPEAARMLAENPDGLTWRFKCIVARALDTVSSEPLPEVEVVPAADVAEEGVAAILEHVEEGDRRNRMLDTFKRYCAGESARKIERETARARGTISADLHDVQDWTGKTFLRPSFGKHSVGPSRDIKQAIARVTRVGREQGQKAASIYDWHALRTSFVTLALSAGVPIELVRRVTGHATTEIVLKHYFRPDREQFKSAFCGTMPAVLTGGPTAKATPAGELATLAAKLAAGTANEDDKVQLRKLAATV